MAVVNNVFYLGRGKSHQGMILKSLFNQSSIPFKSSVEQKVGVYKTEIWYGIKLGF